MIADLALQFSVANSEINCSVIRAWSIDATLETKGFPRCLCVLDIHLFLPLCLVEP